MDEGVIAVPIFRHILTILVVFLLISHDTPGKGQDTRNPLGDLFRSIDRGIRETGDELERAKSGRDILDVRPIQRSEEERRLKQADGLSDQSRWHDAVEVLQFLLNEPTDAFVFRPMKDFRSLQDEATFQLWGLPEEGRRNYLNRYSPVAERLLEQAQKTQDLDLLREVFKKYGPTPAGIKACRLSAQLYEDRGEFLQAASLWQRLARLTTGDEEKECQQNFARTLVLAGRIDVAKKVLPTLSEEEIQAIQRQIPPPSTSNTLNDQPLGPFLTFPDRQFLDRVPSPILSSNWTVSLIERYRIRNRFRDLLDELDDLNIAPIPTAQPLVVGDLLVLRSLRSLQARNIQTGELLWELRKERSPEEIMTETDRSNGSETDEIDPLVDEYRESRLANHRLANLAYRDEIYSGISSDGVRLFSVESTGERGESSMAPLLRSFDEDGLLPTEAGTNELAAYDLLTGRPLWRVGGVKIEDQFSRPMAGTFFLGPPVPTSEGLYILGETDGEVELYLLAAQSGELLWNQPLATPGRPIANEPVRSQWVCRPVIAEGVILCPTGCGWITAIDQATRRLLWATRFSPQIEERRQYRGRDVMQTIQPINRRWHASVPIVVDGRVLVTPPELPDEFGIANPQVYCLDLFTGKLLWEQTKSERSNGTALYLAGQFNDLAILVGTNTVTARRISGQGEVVWTTTLRDRPCGRGLIINDRLLLPIEENRLLRINLEDGKIEQSIAMADSNSSLGNLTLGRGLLISMNYEHLSAFPIDHQIHQLDKSPAFTVKRDLNSVRQQLASGDWKAALASLAEIEHQTELTDSQKTEIAHLRFEGLSLKLPTESDSHQSLEELHRIATSLDQLPRYQRLVADQLRKGGNWGRSLELLLDLFEQSSPDDRVTEDSRTIRIDGWIGGRLQELFVSLPDNDAQERFNEQLSMRMERLKQDPIVRDRWARATSFHPLGQRLEWKLAQDDFAEHRFAAGLVRTRRLASAIDPLLKAESLRLQAEQLTKLGWNQDAMACWERLARLGIVTFSDGQTSAVAANEGIDFIRSQMQQADEQVSWLPDWKLERLGLSGEEKGLSSIQNKGNGYQQLGSLRLLLDKVRDRLRVEDRTTGEVLGNFPLRRHRSIEENPGGAARSQGPYAVVLHQGVLQALDWAGHRIAWRWSPELRGPALSRISLGTGNPQSPFQTVSQFMVARQNQSIRDQTGYLLASNDKALLLLCRDWIALDPITGEELWRDKKSPDRAVAAPTGPSQFVITARNLREIRREIDGKVVNDEAQLELASQSFAVLDDDFIVLKRRLPDGNVTTGGCELQRVRPNGTVQWTHEIPQDAWMLQPDQDTLLWLSKEHELFVVDLRDGTQNSMGKQTLRPRSNQPPLQAFTDSDRIYLLLDDGDAYTAYFNLQGYSVTGSVRVHDRTGKFLWHYDIPRQLRSATSSRRRRGTEQRWPMKLLTQEFPESPLLLLAADVPENSGSIYFHRLRLIGLDKQTGKVAIDWDQPSETGGFSYLNVDRELGFIELRTYNERILLRNEPAESPSPAKEPSN